MDTWIFLKLFENGLATVIRLWLTTVHPVRLSFPTSQGGKCDICHSDVIQKSKEGMVSSHHQLGLKVEVGHQTAAAALDRQIQVHL